MIDLGMVVSVRALAAMMGMTLDELADACGIPRGHLKRVSAGTATMTAKDIVALSTFTGIDPRCIKH